MFVCLLLLVYWNSKIFLISKKDWSLNSMTETWCYILERKYMTKFGNQLFSDFPLSIVLPIIFQISTVWPRIAKLVGSISGWWRTWSTFSATVAPSKKWIGERKSNKVVLRNSEELECRQIRSYKPNMLFAWEVGPCWILRSIFKHRQSASKRRGWSERLEKHVL